jgi:hypothetical protein
MVVTTYCYRFVIISINLLPVKFFFTTLGVTVLHVFIIMDLELILMMFLMHCIPLNHQVHQSTSHQTNESY